LHWIIIEIDKEKQLITKGPKIDKENDNKGKANKSWIIFYTFEVNW